MDLIKQYSVTELNDLIKNYLNEIFSNKIIINGEISNLKITNGNLFLTLKDDESNINVVGWGYDKSKNKIELKNGDKVIVTSKITYYGKSSNINLNLVNIEKLGLGDLHNKYELIKDKCEKLGYFDNSKKKKIPNNIKNIGIVTAPEGAALQDILYVLRKNKFYGNIIIKRTIVQGSSCPKSIIKSIEYLEKWKDNNDKKLDIILVTRGGGSFEDLMGFSDLGVIEKINKCDIFTISAVGHEIDFMLSDYTADIRAPTPSVAAEMISSEQKKYINILETNSKFFEEYFKNLLFKKIESVEYKLENIKSKILKPNEMINTKLDLLNNIYNNILNKTNDVIMKNNNKIQLLEKGLEKYDIDKMLNSGYILLMKSGKIYDSINNLMINQKLKIKMKDGQAEITINKLNRYDK